MVPKLHTSASEMCSDVVFPCGQTIGADGDTINLYYGAADSCVALATGSIRCLLTWLDANSKRTEPSINCFCSGAPAASAVVAETAMLAAATRASVTTAASVAGVSALPAESV